MNKMLSIICFTSMLLASLGARKMMETNPRDELLKSDVSMKDDFIHSHKTSLPTSVSMTDDLLQLTQGQHDTDDKKLNTTRTCPAGTSEIKHSKWIGTAPFCSGSASDCKDIGYDYVKSSGSNCWSGKKVLCEKTTCGMSDDANPECLPWKFKISIYGTAPKCGASPCDCLLAQSIPFRSAGSIENPCQDSARWYQAGGKEHKPCFTGKHYVCLTPTQDVLSGSRGDMLKDMITSERERCVRKEEMNHEKEKQIIEIVGNLAEAGASAAAQGAVAR